MNDQTSCKPGWKLIKCGPNKGKMVPLSERERALKETATETQRNAIRYRLHHMRREVPDLSGLTKYEAGNLIRQLGSSLSEEEISEALRGLPPIEQRQLQPQMQPIKAAADPSILLAPFITVAPYILIALLAWASPTAAGIIVVFDLMCFFLSGLTRTGRSRKYLPLLWWFGG